MKGHTPHAPGFLTLAAVAAQVTFGDIGQNRRKIAPFSQLPTPHRPRDTFLTRATRNTDRTALPCAPMSIRTACLAGARSAKAWLRPPRHVLVVFLGVAVLSTGALGWLAWRVVRQEAELDTQRQRVALEQAADAVVGSMQQSLAGLITLTAQPPHSIANVPVNVSFVNIEQDAATVKPAGTLPYLPVVATRREAPGEIFASGQDAEFRLRDLSRASRIYSALAAATDPAVRAGALGRLARARRALGDVDGALAAYDAVEEQVLERIVRAYGDQPQASVARNRLQTTDGGPDRTSFVKILDEDASNGAASSNGRIAFPGGGFPQHMFVYDLTTGVRAPVTDEAGKRNAIGGVISKEGRRVAYESCTDDECDVRIVSVALSDPQPSRILFREDGHTGIHLLDWSSDGKTIAVRIRRADRTSQLGLLTVSGGSLVILKSLDWRGVSAAFFSPDGRHLLYDVFPGDAGNQRDVFVISVDGTQEFPAASDPAYDTAMGWTNDGRFLLFASDRIGSRDLWRLAVANGRPKGRPELVMSNIGNSVSLGMSSRGALYLSRRAGGGRDIEIAPIDLAAAHVTAPPSSPISSHVGANSQPAWSPDGKSLVYLSRRGSANDIALMVHSFETGRDREIPVAPALSWLIGPTWSPNGRRFAVIGNDLKGRHGVFLVEAATGEVIPVTLTNFAPPSDQSERLTYEGAGWSPDGARLYYHKAGGGILEWTFATASERKVTEGPYGPISLSPDGRLIATYRLRDRARQADAGPAMVIIRVDGGEAREVWHLNPGELGLTRFGGHLLKGRYDVHHVRNVQTSTRPAAL